MHFHYYFFYWLPFYLYSTIIFLLSSQKINTPASIKTPDKLFHIIEYSILCYLLIRALTLSKKSYSEYKIYFITLFTCTLFAITDEIIQFFVPGRSCSVFDILADFSGIIITIAVLASSQYIKKRQ